MSESEPDRDERPRRRRLWAVRRLATVLSTLALLALAAGCANGSPQGTPESPTTVPRSLRPHPVADHHPRPVTKLLVFVIENHSFDQVRSGMPFIYALAKDYAYATDYRAMSHPSLPNYLAITGGSTFGITDDNPPSAHVLPGHSVFGQALALHRTAKLYADGMPAPCDLDNGGDNYAVKHNPWAYFVAERADCQRHDVPVTQLAQDVAAGQLPNAGMVIPNLEHDAHDGTLAQADAWLRTKIGMISRGPDWRSGRLAIVVTADEDDGGSGNRVLTLLASRSVHRGPVTDPLDHCSLTLLYDEVLGAEPLGCASSATSMSKAFGLEVQ